MNVEHEIEQLCAGIRRLGTKQADGTTTVTFKQLFDDDDLANTLEAMVGTLKAAKKRGIVSYKSELLMQGMSDNEVITLQA